MTRPRFPVPLAAAFVATAAFALSPAAGGPPAAAAQDLGELLDGFRKLERFRERLERDRGRDDRDRDDRDRYDPRDRDRYAPAPGGNAPGLYGGDYYTPPVRRDRVLRPDLPPRRDVRRNGPLAVRAAVALRVRPVGVRRELRRPPLRRAGAGRAGRPG